jgi:hypothetical protein
MPFHRDVLVAALAFGTAISLYLYSFHDLIAVPAASAGADDSSRYVGHL